MTSEYVVIPLVVAMEVSAALRGCPCNPGRANSYLEWDVPVIEALGRLPAPPRLDDPAEVDAETLHLPVPLVACWRAVLTGLMGCGCPFLLGIHEDTTAFSQHPHVRARQALDELMVDQCEDACRALEQAEIAVMADEE